MEVNNDSNPPLARHGPAKTHKRSTSETPVSTSETPVSTTIGQSQSTEQFRNLLDESAREAFARPWHRLERGLRLNRLRMYVEQMSPQCSFTNEEKINFFNFLQRALDRKLLNTHKIVNYIPEQQRIESIRGLEVRRAPDGTARWGFTTKKPKDTATRKKKRVGGDEETPDETTS